jgi:hypothetical protein
MRIILTVAVLAAAVPALAEWKAANPDVTAAAQNPDVAAVLAQAARVDAAIVAGDRAGFLAVFAPDARVNSPNNRVHTAVDAAEQFDKGFIRYAYLRRSIEHAGQRGNGEVVLMGEEALEPRLPHPLAGKAVRRRFTDIWQKQDGGWKLALRQATIFDVK